MLQLREINKIAPLGMNRGLDLLVLLCKVVSQSEASAVVDLENHDPFFLENDVAPVGGGHFDIISVDFVLVGMPTAVLPHQTFPGRVFALESKSVEKRVDFAQLHRAFIKEDFGASVGLLVDHRQKWVALDAEFPNDVGGGALDFRELGSRIGPYD